MQRIFEIVKKFEESGVATIIERRFSGSVANIAIVSKSVAKDPNVLIPYRAQELELLSYCTLWRILHLDLHLQRESKESVH